MRTISVEEYNWCTETNITPQDTHLEEERINWQDVTCMMSSMDEDIPKNYEDAMKSKNCENWRIAMNEEIKSLLENNTWILVIKPANKQLLDNKWCYVIKRNPNDTIERFKARLVTRGFRQIPGVDFNETYSPVVKYTSVRLLFAYAAMTKMFIRQFDVKTAFLYVDLQEDVYMEQPKGFADGSN